MAHVYAILARIGLFDGGHDALLEARFAALTTRQARLASRKRVSPFKFVSKAA